MLALAVKLHLDGQKPWPVRRQVSRAYWSVTADDRRDYVAAAGEPGYYRLDRYRSGNVKKHESIITQRFIQPSDELIEIVQRSILQRTKDEKNAIRLETWAKDQSAVKARGSQESARS